MSVFSVFRAAISAARLAIFAVMATLLFACSAPGEETLVLHTATGNYTFHVEIADTPASREKGLMFRTALAPDAGMLFDFHREAQQAFWMQNTYIALDMIFIAEDGTVKTIHQNARPMDTTAIPSGVPVRFVLEIAGGRSAAIGLRAGDKMDQARVGTPETGG
jgi:uncharacterized protein